MIIHKLLQQFYKYIMIDYKLTKNKFPLNLNIIKWIILLIRVFFGFFPAVWLIAFHQIFYKILFIDIIRRYIECISNLICIRIILLLLGFTKFQNSSFKFFDHSYNNKFTLRSGFIGIANHSNIIDFLFYTYLLSPLYVKILIVMKENGQKQNLYIPLSFLEAFECAKSARGFEPIIIPQKELNKIKQRKLKMNLLVVQSFENLKGPILILLPGIHPQNYVNVDSKIIEVLGNNQEKFSRWVIGFCIRLKQPIFQKLYQDQIELLFELMCDYPVTNNLSITISQFHRNNYYQKSFQQSINELYESCGLTKIELSYEQYIKGFDKKQMENNNQQENKEQTDSQVDEDKIKKHGLEQKEKIE